MQFRVLVELRGIPSHAWSATAAWAVLGDACACPEPTPVTTARSDLRRFQAVTWCADPDLIPNAAFLRIPDRRDPNAGAELFLRPDEIIYHKLPLLNYRVEVEILEIQDWRGDSEESDDPYGWPDCWWSESEDEDEHPGFRDPSSSPPLPRKTVFRRLGGKGSSSSSFEGDNGTAGGSK
jgi:hypothetical protein